MISERLRHKIARHRMRTIFHYRYGMSMRAALPIDETDYLQRRWEFHKTFDTSGVPQEHWVYQDWLRSSLRKRHLGLTNL